MKISLKNDKSFEFKNETSIFHAAQASGIVLEHSCLSGRCRSCIVKVLSGKTVDIREDIILSKDEKRENFILSCNSRPLSNLKLDIEDLGNIKLFKKKIVPAKISSIEIYNNDVIKLVLRLPPTTDFKFISGQYVNLIKGDLKRSYSIANKSDNKNQLEFFIKKYENGLMSKYWFDQAKVNDLLRVEGPLGSFFLRETQCENIVFLATGTGIAPIKAIFESVSELPLNFNKKKFWIFVGARYEKDLIWDPTIINNKIQVTYIPVLSRQINDWDGEKGYIQEVVLRQKINLENAQVYACGSNEMIQAAKKLLIKNSLKENNFYSDAFVSTN